MSGGPGSAGTNKKQKWGWSRYVHMLWGHFFQPRMRLYVSHIYLCLWFRFTVPEPYYLCLLSRSVPLRFYVNFSYQRFSLWGLAVLCEWLDGHSSLCLFLAHTDTHAHTHSERWLMCGRSVWGARAAEVGWRWHYVKWCGSPGQPSSALLSVCIISLAEQVYCPSRGKK